MQFSQDDPGPDGSEFNPEVSLGELAADVSEIGYPGAAEAEPGAADGGGRLPFPVHRSSSPAAAERYRSASWEE